MMPMLLLLCLHGVQRAFIEPARQQRLYGRLWLPQKIIPTIASIISLPRSIVKILTFFLRRSSECCQIWWVSTKLIERWFDGYACERRFTMEARETTAKRQLDWSLASGSSSQWCNMERASGARKNDNCMSMACMSSLTSGCYPDGHRSIHGHNWLLLQRFRTRRTSQQLDSESEERTTRPSPEQLIVHRAHHHGSRRWVE